MTAVNRLHYHTAYMVSLESRLDQYFLVLSQEVANHPQVSNFFNQLVSISGSQLTALKKRLDTIAWGIDLPVSNLPSFEPKNSNFPVSSALQNASALINHAIVGYAMLRSIALRYRDSSLIGDDNTGDMAERHTKSYVKAVHEINKILHNVVLWEMETDGEICQCTCPSCGLGICMCAQGPRRTLSDIWQEPGPISTENNVFVHPPRPDSAADKAGLHQGDTVLAADGEELESHFTLQGKVSAHNSGEEVVLKVRRSTGEIEEVSVMCP